MLTVACDVGIFQDFIGNSGKILVVRHALSRNPQNLEELRKVLVLIELIHAALGQRNSMFFCQSTDCDGADRPEKMNVQIGFRNAAKKRFPLLVRVHEGCLFVCDRV
jgi:hypothetical protein